MTEEEQKIVNDYKELLKRSGWKLMDTEDGCAWFGGKSHYSLADYLPQLALKNQIEDLDFLVVGWRR